MHFEFSTAASILFGPGISRQVPGLAAKQGQHVFVVTDSQERCQSILDGLSQLGLSVVIHFVDGEPDLDSVSMATRKAEKSDCQSIIGLGGGSTIDTGKAAAALMANPGNLLDYLEVVGAGRTLENPPIPYIAIPTTAGTGSEVTRNVVITVPEERLKVSLRSPFLLPRIAVIDPELTYSLPPSITATTGMDALTQLIEPFVCNSPTPLTDVLCRAGISRAARSLRKAFENGLDANAREEMALASLLGGMALANARLGAVHGMATPIGGVSGAPHGAVCARLLPLVMETNLHALRIREPDSSYITRYDEIACLLTGYEKAGADAGVNWINELRQALDIHPLKEYGLNPEDFQAIVEQSQRASSMKGNPIKLTDEELTNILENAVGN
jgi:alcohol dehydrogenase class IV